MDLSEIRSHTASRHPWEVARANALETILRRRQSSFDRVLDLGCGDGFTGEHVLRAFAGRELVGVDLHLPAEACGVRRQEQATVELTQDLASVGERRFDLVLLCDVIEHVADDVAMLRDVATRRLAPGGFLLITVPAFQALFSDHDRALKHYRRYSLSSLRKTIAAAELRIEDDGYLFGTLLPPRAAQKLVESSGRQRAQEEHGIGGWRGGPLLTRAVVELLRADNSLLLLARRVGLTLPGLTAWALCKTP